MSTRPGPNLSRMRRGGAGRFASWRHSRGDQHDRPGFLGRHVCPLPVGRRRRGSGRDDLHHHQVPGREGRGDPGEHLQHRRLQHRRRLPRMPGGGGGGAAGDAGQHRHSLLARRRVARPPTPHRPGPGHHRDVRLHGDSGRHHRHLHRAQHTVRAAHDRGDRPLSRRLGRRHPHRPPQPRGRALARRRDQARVHQCRRLRRGRHRGVDGHLVIRHRVGHPRSLQTEGRIDDFPVQQIQAVVLR